MSGPWRGGARRTSCRVGQQAATEEADGPVMAAPTSHESTPGFSSVYVDNLDRVYGFLGYRLRSRHEAEDLTQLVFEKALRSWNRFDPRRASPSTWLIAIARNVLVDHLRRRRETLMGDDAVAAALDRGAEAVEPGISGELGIAMSNLSPREQTVLALRFGADCSGSEIAELMELSTDNAHQILSRALRKLRTTLDEDSGS